MILMGIYLVLWALTIVAAIKSGNSGHGAGLAAGFAALGLFFGGSVIAICLGIGLAICSMTGISQLWATLIAAPMCWVAFKLLFRRKE